MKKKIPLEKILEDSRVQPRAELNQQAIDDYAAAMRDGVKFPAIVVFEDEEGNLKLAHGYHRYRAAIQADLTEIMADVRKGDIHEARLVSACANKAQDKIGVRWTNKDKRHAVKMLLDDEKWASKSDRWIAQIVGVSGEMVRGMRPALPTVGNATRETMDGRKYPARRKAKGGEENNEAGRNSKRDQENSERLGGLGREGIESTSDSERSDIHRESIEEQSDANSKRINWGKEYQRLQKEITALVKEFDCLEDKLDELLAELRDFYAGSSLKKEGEELRKETLKIVHMADRVRGKFSEA